MKLNEYVDVVDRQIMESIGDLNKLKMITAAAEKDLKQSSISVADRKWFWEQISQRLAGRRPAIKAQTSDALSQAVEYVLAQLASLSDEG
jgi:hypothetical protein